MPSSRPNARLLDIVENIDRILRYVDGSTFEAYESDEKSVDAVERCLGRIAEAGAKLGEAAPNLLPAHDWRAIQGFGNILRHEYDAISQQLIWDIIRTELPALRRDCLEAVSRLDDSDE